MDHGVTARGPEGTLGRTTSAGALALSMTGTDWRARAKLALYRNFEAVLVLALVGSLLFISSFVVQKFAFLLFYFIPVLLAGYYLSPKHAVLTALLTAGLVTYVTIMNPFGMKEDAGESLNFWNLVTWASFLILTGAIVGKLQEKNREQTAHLREAYLGIIQILTKYLEAADAYTKSHSERVASVSAIIAERMGLLAAEVQNVWTAGLLHDIGKTEVIELIQKSSALEPHEKEKVDAHAELGAQLLLTTGTVLRDAVPLVMDHHRPYHDGGDAIPVGARIISVADAYDAIVSDRPYRAARTHWQAVDILREAAGRQFDPRVVDALEASADLVLAQYKEGSPA